jgi:hypothetical protein
MGVQNIIYVCVVKWSAVLAWQWLPHRNRMASNLKIVYYPYHREEARGYIWPLLLVSSFMIGLQQAETKKWMQGPWNDCKKHCEYHLVEEG